GNARISNGSGTACTPMISLPSAIEYTKSPRTSLVSGAAPGSVTAERILLSPFLLTSMTSCMWDSVVATRVGVVALAGCCAPCPAVVLLDWAVLDCVALGIAAVGVVVADAAALVFSNVSGLSINAPLTGICV